MIEVEGLTKRYGEFQAVSNLSFSIKRGEIVGFLGPNGAGKTTTMRMLTGFLPASEGKVLVGGNDVFENPMAVKKKIGYLPEHPPLYTDMNVEGYLSFVSKIRGVPRSDRSEAIDWVLGQCNLVERRRSLIGKLSKGFRQRVGLAGAMISKPEVLILDEPTSGLDPKQIIDIREMIKSLGGTQTIILSTHILAEVVMICNRLLIINRGRIVADDTMENLTAEESLEAVFIRLTSEDVQ